MRITITLLAMLIGAALSLCDSVAWADSGTPLSDALKDCAELKLPNSMAREPGFDLEAHLQAVQSRYRRAAQNLATPAGIEAIRKFLGTHPDDLDTLCAVEIAGITRRPEARAILERYTNSSIPGLSEIARHYLSEQK